MISLHSWIRESILSGEINSEPTKSLSQNFVSIADFLEMLIKLTNSFREMAALPSTKFAPMDVAERISCLTITKVAVVLGSWLESLIILMANLKARSSISFPRLSNVLFSIGLAFFLFFSLTFLYGVLLVAVAPPLLVLSLPSRGPFRL